MQCANHPDVETNLRCGKCGKPICPACVVQTPVGIRCRECANLKRLPIYEVSARHYLIATGVGLGIGLATGYVWALMWQLIPFLLLNFLIAAGVGYTIGESISRSVNRKRSIGLQVIAGLSMLLSYLIANVALFHALAVPISLSFVYDLLALALGVFLAIRPLR
jgi:hypothetical protein